MPPSKRNQYSNNDLAMHVAVLDQQTQEMSSRFDYITTRFEKILERVEQLTLNTTTLITQHATKINSLEQQVSKTEEVLTHNQRQNSEAVQKSIDAVSESLDDLKNTVVGNQEKTDKRLSSLERVRWIIIGIGISIGFALGNLDKIVDLFIK